MTLEGSLTKELREHGLCAEVKPGEAASLNVCVRGDVTLCE